MHDHENFPKKTATKNKLCIGKGVIPHKAYAANVWLTVTFVFKYKTFNKFSYQLKQNLTDH